MTTERGPSIPHRTVVLSNGFAPQGAPELFGANCSCGWESDGLWSDPEAAEQEGANHEREARSDA